MNESPKRCDGNRCIAVLRMYKDSRLFLAATTCSSFIACVASAKGTGKGRSVCVCVCGGGGGGGGTGEVCCDPALTREILYVPT